jgi:hypothetical protein
MSLFDESTTEVLLKFLDKKAKDAEEEIATKGTLSEEHAIPLILKTLFNHVAHLDMEITELRKSIDSRFGEVNRRFHQLNISITLGFTIIAFLIILFGFLK